MLNNEMVIIFFIICSFVLCLSLGFYLHKKFPTDTKINHYITCILLGLIMYSIIILYSLFICEITQYYSFSPFSLFTTLYILYLLIIPLILLFLFDKDSNAYEYPDSDIEEKQKLKKEDSEDSIVDMRYDFLDENEEDYLYEYLELYTYYIIIIIVINLILYVLFEIHFFSPYKNKLTSSLVLPIEVIKFSFLVDFGEILCMINFSLIIGTISKFCMLIYIPYSISSLIMNQFSFIIELVEKKEKDIGKKKEEHIDFGNKNDFQIIKKLTNLMRTGKPLTKNEKKLLKSYNESFFLIKSSPPLDGKKDSLLGKIKCLIWLILSIILFILILLSAIVVIIFKILSVYLQLVNNYCGYECGWLVKESFKQSSIQSVLFNFKNSKLNIVFFLFIPLFFFFALLNSLKRNGIFNFYYFEFVTFEKIIKANSYLGILYCLFGVIAIGSFIDIMQEIPFVAFSIKKDNNISISQFGVFDLKNRMNFTLFKYLDLFYEICFCLLTVICLLFKIAAKSLKI